MQIEREKYADRNDIKMLTEIQWLHPLVTKLKIILTIFEKNY